MKTLPFVFSVLMFVSCAWTAHADEEGISSSWLTLEADITPTSPIQGQEIIVAVTLTNTSHQVQTLPLPVGVSDNILYPKLRNKNGMIVGRIERDGPRDPMLNTALKPGESIRKLFDLDAWHPVLAAGDYELIFAYQFPSDKPVISAQAPTISFQIRPLTDETELAAQKLYDVVVRGGYDEEFGRLDAIDEFMEQYPHSMFVPLVRLKKFVELFNRKRYDEVIAEGHKMLEDNLFTPGTFKHFQVWCGIVGAFYRKGDKERAIREIGSLPEPYARHAAATFGIHAAMKTPQRAETQPGVPIDEQKRAAGSIGERNEPVTGKAPAPSPGNVGRETANTGASAKPSPNAMSFESNTSRAPIDASDKSGTSTHWGHIVAVFVLGCAIGVAVVTRRRGGKD